MRTTSEVINVLFLLITVSLNLVTIEISSLDLLHFMVERMFTKVLHLNSFEVIILYLSQKLCQYFFIFFLRNHVKCVGTPRHVCISWGDLLTLLDAEFRTLQFTKQY